jgi:hypothetical protein
MPAMAATSGSSAIDRLTASVDLHLPLSYVRRAVFGRLAPDSLSRAGPAASAQACVFPWNSYLQLIRYLPAEISACTLVTLPGHAQKESGQ